MTRDLRSGCGDRLWNHPQVSSPLLFTFCVRFTVAANRGGMIRHPVIGLTEAGGDSNVVLTSVFQARIGAELLGLRVNHHQAYDVTAIVGSMTL